MAQKNLGYEPNEEDDEDKLDDGLPDLSSVEEGNGNNVPYFLPKDPEPESPTLNTDPLDQAGTSVDVTRNTGRRRKRVIVCEDIECHSIASDDENMPGEGENEQLPDNGGTPG